MIQVAPHIRILLSVQPADFRKGIDGLSQVCRQVLSSDPFSGYSCLTFLICPEHEWISLRTTKITERLNKEFKRRTKPMEIVPGENVSYTLQSFICLKMELHWKFKPIGEVGKNLPFLKKLGCK